jgi:hypothetical protein
VCLQSCCPPHTRLPPGTHTPPCAPTPSFVPMQALIQAMGGPLLSHSIHVPSIDMSEDEYLVPDTGRHTGRWLVTWLPGWCIRQCYSVSVCVHASWPDIVGHVLVHHVRSIMSGVLPPPPPLHGLAALPLHLGLCKHGHVHGYRTSKLSCTK